MSRIFIILGIVITVAGCAENQQKGHSTSTTPPVLATEHQRTEENAVWSIYASDPNHPWNRVFHQFYRRATKEGKEYGATELDPLLWFDTTYLLHGDSYQQALQVLDEFLGAHAENLIHDPLKRAVFQRDMWSVFDWLSFQPDPYPSQRQALAMRLAQIIKRVALTKEEILSLPDNYQLAVESNVFPDHFQADHPDEAFLPGDLFQANSAWLPMGREGGPIAMAHTEQFPFVGRSVFLIFVRSPDGRKATLDFIHSLNKDPSQARTAGFDLALLRRMLLIDSQGDLILSPLVESMQIRHFRPPQVFHEFELDRMDLFGGFAGGLRLNSELFLLFFSHGDVFEGDHGPELKAIIPDICESCHFEYRPIPDPNRTQTILSYSRFGFPLPDEQQPVLADTTWENEAQIIIEWKSNHSTWRALEALWHSTP